MVVNMNRICQRVVFLRCCSLIGDYLMIYDDVSGHDDYHGGGDDHVVDDPWLIKVVVLIIAIVTYCNSNYSLEEVEILSNKFVFAHI